MFESTWIRFLIVIVFLAVFKTWQFFKAWLNHFNQRPNTSKQILKELASKSEEKKKHTIFLQIENKLFQLFQNKNIYSYFRFALILNQTSFDFNDKINEHFCFNVLHIYFYYNYCTTVLLKGFNKKIKRILILKLKKIKRSIYRLGKRLFIIFFQFDRLICFYVFIWKIFSLTVLNLMFPEKTC